ncbi:MAG: IS110 family transposase [Candidatus Limnocylindria bacterium]
MPFSIPGIDPLGAATVVAEVWDVSRFASPERLTSWAGLTPTERSSAEHTRRGHTSKQGSRWLRWICVEAATHAVRDPDLGRFAARIARRRGVKIAASPWLGVSSPSVTTPCATPRAVPHTRWFRRAR